MNFKSISDLALSEKHKFREGVPSCSSLERLWACPASFEEQKKFKPKPSSSDASRGTILHKMMELDSCPFDAPDDYHEAFKKAQGMRNSLVDRFGLVERESESYFGSDELTGSMDEIFYSSDRKMAVIVDYKFGHIRTEAKEQLTGYAYLLYNREPSLKEIYVGVCQPACSSRIDVQLIEKEKAEQRIKLILENRKLTDQFNAGWDWCKYCKAFGNCEKTKINIGEWI